MLIEAVSLLDKVHNNNNWILGFSIWIDRMGWSLSISGDAEESTLEYILLRLVGWPSFALKSADWLSNHLNITRSRPSFAERLQYYSRRKQHRGRR